MEYLYNPKLKWIGGVDSADNGKTFLRKMHVFFYFFVGKRWKQMLAMWPGNTFSGHGLLRKAAEKHVSELSPAISISFVWKKLKTFLRNKHVSVNIFCRQKVETFFAKGMCFPTKFLLKLKIPTDFFLFQ